MGSWVGPREGLGFLEKRKNFFPYRDSKPESPSCKLETRKLNGFDGVTLYNILSRSTYFCEVIGDNRGKDM
jgi:hypothetical protein